MKVQLDEGARMPTRAHTYDAGYDLYSPVTAMIPARGSLVVDTGVHMQIPRGCAGVIHPRSSMNVKNGIICQGLIDSGYTGSIKVKLVNTTCCEYMVMSGTRIAQIVIERIKTPALKLGKLRRTDRGDSGFGSTGK